MLVWKKMNAHGFVQPVKNETACASRNIMCNGKNSYGHNCGNDVEFAHVFVNRSILHKSFIVKALNRLVRSKP